jgi:ligand-binding SRPBCC domain-containing protein
MSQEYILRRTQRLPLPPERVFEFFADAGNLEVITPPFLNFQIVTPTPIAMRPGALIEYRLRLFGVPFGWRTEIESYDPPRSFVDQQLRGPYALWHHTHTFAPIAPPTGSAAANGSIETEMTDIVRYRLPLGPLGRIAHVLFVRRTLATIFDYRRDRIAELIRA